MTYATNLHERLAPIVENQTIRSMNMGQLADFLAPKKLEDQPQSIGFLYLAKKAHQFCTQKINQCNELKNLINNVQNTYLTIDFNLKHQLTESDSQFDPYKIKILHKDTISALNELYSIHRIEGLSRLFLTGSILGALTISAMGGSFTKAALTLSVESITLIVGMNLYTSYLRNKTDIFLTADAEVLHDKSKSIKNILSHWTQSVQEYQNSSPHLSSVFRKQLKRVSDQ